MASTIYLARAAMIYYELRNEIIKQNEAEDELFIRLNRDSTAYALHYQLAPLDISSLDNDTCESLFRFTYTKIREIAIILGFPKQVSFISGTNKSFLLHRNLALAIMLRRLAYPSKLMDLELLFKMSKPTISVVSDLMVELLYDRYHEGIKFNKNHLHSFNLTRFSDATERKGCCYEGVVGFIGGTLNATTHPVGYQDRIYTGHVQSHGLKYQGIVTPDGITVSLCGPFPGSIHDQNMLVGSGITGNLRKYLNWRSEGGKLYAIYGNQDHNSSLVIIKPFKNSKKMDTIKKDVNDTMSALRIAAEWEFRHVANLFGFIKCRPGQTASLSRHDHFYTVATLLKNIHICVNGGRTSRHFNIRPPTLVEYIDEISPQ